MTVGTNRGTSRPSCRVSPSAPLVNSDHGESGWYQGNYLNWVYYHADQNQRDNLPQVTRIQGRESRTVRRRLAFERLQFGIWEFNGDDGGRIVSQVGSDVATLQSDIAARRADGYTPLGETMLDIAHYLEDKHSEPTPIQYKCQTTFLIVVTDGWPTRDVGNSLSSEIGDQDGDGNEPGSCTSVGAPYSNSLDCSDYMDDVAYYLANTDLSDLNGTQSCVTYTIGFNVDAGVLQSAADNGTGTYFNANSAETLWMSLSAAINDIVSRKSSGTAAAVVDRDVE